MPLLPPNVSYRPDNTPLFAAAGGGGGGVNNVVGGNQITVDSTNPAAPIVNWALGVGDGLQVTAGAAPNIALNLAAGANITITPPVAPGSPVTIAATAAAGLAPITAFTFTAASADLKGNQPSAANIPIGSFVAPRTGMYLFTESFTMNVGADAGGGVDGSATFGVSDNVGMILSQAPGNFNFINIKPFSMPSTNAASPGQDYVLSSTLPVLLTAGLTYTAAGFINNISGTVHFPDIASNGYGRFNVSITALC